MRRGSKVHASLGVFTSSLLLSMVLILGAQSTLSQAFAREGTVSKGNKTARLRAEVVDLKLKLEQAPGDEKTLVQLSRKQIQLGQLPEALTHLREAASINAKNAQTSYLIAFTLRRLKRYREAADAYEQFLTVAPESQKSSGLFGLAKTLELLGDTTRAVETYQQFVEIEKRPERKRWVIEAQSSIRQLRASQVALIDSSRGADEPDEVAESASKAHPDKLAVAKAREGAPSKEVRGAQEKSALSTLSTADQAPQGSLQSVLERADKMFAAKKYAEATQAYQQIATRSLPVKLEAQIRYFAAVSAYLGAQFAVAQRQAELGLLLQPKSSRLRGLAVLSFVQHHERNAQTSEGYKEVFAQIRLALREGRFNNCLALIDQLVTSAESQSSIPKVKSGNQAKSSTRPVDSLLSDPLLLHAKGRALLGLKRYQEAYEVLKRASRGLKHPHLTLDLALTARRLGDLKSAQVHFNDLKRQTAPAEGTQSSLLHLLAGEGAARE